jgi:hypothetical protein
VTASAATAAVFVRAHDITGWNVIEIADRDIALRHGKARDQNPEQDY